MTTVYGFISKRCVQKSIIKVKGKSENYPRQFLEESMNNPLKKRQEKIIQNKVSFSTKN
jgi:hypothetical protein